MASRRLSAWSGIILVLSAVLYAITSILHPSDFPRVLGGVLFGIALGWLGYALLTTSNSQVARTD
jgi:hypothetical protein